MCLAAATMAQPYQPFGIDGAMLDQGRCNPAVGCKMMDDAASIGVQWVRLGAIWHDIQPTQNGGYNWGSLPYAVWYAQQKGISIYFTAVWAPKWANGAISDCNPFSGANQNNKGTSVYAECANGWQDVGRTVTNSSFTYNFFYNLVREFNGNSNIGCATNEDTCHPLVQYFGVWNEPNGLNNYNDTYYNPNNLGNYLNDFVTQYLFPAKQAIVDANPTAYLIAPEVGTGNSITCGGFNGCSDWFSSWVHPLLKYFSTSFDIISIHGYNSESTDKDNVWLLSNFRKPIWMTETAYANRLEET